MKLRRGVILSAGILAVAAAMGASIRNGFVYDDAAAIVGNPRVTDPSQWHTIALSPYWIGTLWRPFTVAAFAGEWWIGGGAPWVFHLVSLMAYLATGLALVALLRRVGIGEWAAAGAALIFLVHPVHVEAVANGVGQSEIWTGFALLGATLLYLRARQRGATPAAVIALVFMVAIAIAAKEQGFMAPLLLAGAEVILVPAGPIARRDTARTLLGPVVLVTLLLFAIRTAVLNGLAGEVPATAFRAVGIGGRGLTFLAVVPEYARLMLWPLHLQADYGPPGIPVGGAFGVRHLLGVVLVVAFIAGMVALRRRSPVAAFGLFWAAATLAPVSNLLTATGIVMAERVLFLPTIGAAIALAPLLEAVWKHARGDASRRIAIAVTLAWGVALAVRSALRVSTWETQQRFYADLTADAPTAYRAWKASGEYWEGAGNHARAVANLQHAIELWPHDPEVNEELGQFLRGAGQCDAAIPVLRSGLTLDPRSASVRAKLIECLIAVRQWNEADRMAADGIALGATEFRSEAARVERLRAADSVAPGPGEPRS